MSSKVIPLMDYNREYILNDNNIIQLGSELCVVISAMQKSGIIVDAIMPGDIGVSSENKYIIDYAKLLNRRENGNGHSYNKEEMPYVAPEVLQGKAYDTTAMIYSLGAIMYMLLNNGRCMFFPEYPAEISDIDWEVANLKRMIETEIPLPNNGSYELYGIIKKMCAINPKDRYNNPLELARVINKAKDSHDIPGFKGEFQTALSHKASNDNKNTIERDIISSKVYASNIGEIADDTNITFDELIAEEDFLENVTDDIDADISAEIDDSVSLVIENHRASFDSNGTDRIKKSYYSVPEKKSNKKIIIISLVIILLLAIGGLGVYLSIPKEVTDITGLEDIEIYYDESYTVNCSIEPDYFADENITYTSSDSKIFEVSADGEIQPMMIGEADLTVTAKGYSESVKVTVKSKVTKITGVDESYRIVEGDGYQLEIKLEPEKYSSEPILFESSDPKVAKVDKNGHITGVSAGEATVTISAGGISKSITIEVTEPVVVKQAVPATHNTPSKKPASNDNEEFGGDEFF